MCISAVTFLLHLLQNPMAVTLSRPTTSPNHSGDISAKNNESYNDSSAKHS